MHLWHQEALNNEPVFFKANGFPMSLNFDEEFVRSNGAQPNIRLTILCQLARLLVATIVYPPFLRTLELSEIKRSMLDKCSIVRFEKTQSTELFLIGHISLSISMVKTLTPFFWARFAAWAFISIPRIFLVFAAFAHQRVFRPSQQPTSRKIPPAGILAKIFFMVFSLYFSAPL